MSVYERYGMRRRGSGVGCGVVRWVKRSSMRWFGNIERMENEEFFKVYLSSVEVPKRRGRPLGRWEDRVKEYVSKREMRERGKEGKGKKELKKGKKKEGKEGEELRRVAGRRNSERKINKEKI